MLEEEQQPSCNIYFIDVYLYCTNLNLAQRIHYLVFLLLAKGVSFGVIEAIVQRLMNQCPQHVRFSHGRVRYIYGGVGGLSPSVV